MNTLFRTTILLITIILYSCGKSELPIFTETAPPDNADGKYNYEKIYKDTGCKVNNSNTILILNPLFTDSSGFRYLYGARKSEEGQIFWFSKYTSKGDLVWEITKSPNNELYTRALHPKELSNGDIVIACIVDKDGSILSDSKTMIPTVVSKDDGTATFIKVLNTYFYSYINVYDGFFICGIDDRELASNASASRWFSQISNGGNILLSIPEMSKTNESTIFLSNDEMITFEEKYIERAFLDRMKDSKWTKMISLPIHKSYKLKSSLIGNLLTVTYDLVLLDDKEQEINYKLDAKTGGDYIAATNIELDREELVLAINKTYNLKVKITPLDASDAKITWESSNENIATVSEYGFVTGISEGDCDISASINGASLERKCKVKVSNIKASGISLDRTSINIVTGSMSELIAIITPTDAYADIVWSSSDNSIASVNNGVITAINEGECIITATTSDGQFSASCIVSVADPIITDMIKLYFSSSSVISINGIITGTIYSTIVNKSKNDITLTRFEVRDSNTNRIVLYSEDQSKLGILQADNKNSLGGPLYSVYNPKFTWFFAFDGKEYQISHYYK